MKTCYWRGSEKIVKNAHYQNGKQNYKCPDCRRQFVEEAHHIVKETKNTVCKLLLERLFLRGICRATGARLPWLSQFLQGEVKKVRSDLNAQVIDREEVQVVGLEVDELWLFVKCLSHIESKLIFFKRLYLIFFNQSIIPHH